MKTISRRALMPVMAALAAVMVGAPLLAGCKGGDKVQPISRVLADPSSFEDKDIIVAGKVVKVLDPTSGLLGLSAYQVEDSSGKIWVVTRTGAPEVGREVGLKGRVRRDFKFGSEVLGAVLNEVERRTR